MTFQHRSPPHPRKKWVFTMRAFFHGDCKFKWICGNLTKAIATESTSTISIALVWDYFPILIELITQTRQQGKEWNDVAIKKSMIVVRRRESQVLRQTCRANFVFPHGTRMLFVYFETVLLGALPQHLSNFFSI